MRLRLCWTVCVFLASSAHAEVASVTITDRSVIADGRSFGSTGPYERLVGRIEFALDPEAEENASIVDLEHAARGADGRVHFSSDLYVLQPSDPTKGNGVLLFDIGNRGNIGTVLSLFARGGIRDTAASPNVGDGLLMNDGYTLVWVGWEFDVPPARHGIEPPAALLPPGTQVQPLGVDLMVNAPTTEAQIVDEPVRPPVVYPPGDPSSAAHVLTVRPLFWSEAKVIPRERWRFVSQPDEPPRIQLDDGFEPGLWYRITYRPSKPVVAGVGFAAIRDAASAFRYRTDLPITGRTAYAFGQSQTGRFMRQFLYEGFNVDGSGRRVFDALWIHIAGAALGSFNERFATPAHGDMFRATRFPFADREQTDVDGTRAGLQYRYPAEQRPKVFYTNTPVEYWGGGRAAALTHTSVDGTRDLTLPDNVRMYFLAGVQHLIAPFPPTRAPGEASNPAARNDGQELSNPTPQANVLRGLLEALHQWAADGTEPPASRYPRLADGTLVPVQKVRFPTLPGVADPRRIVGPARLIDGRVMPLPHLVPQVDADGNDLGGVRDPEVAVPLATTTGWNFRAERVGNTDDIYQTLGSYIPFAANEADRDPKVDGRASIGERYRGLDDYLERVRAAANDLVRQRLMLAEDVDAVIARARSHWDFATREAD